MDGQYATKEEFWKMQETLNDLSGIQSQHSERIMRLEKRRDDDVRVKGVWAPSSPFGNVLGSTPHPESTLNPTAEAFRNFDSEPATGMISSLSLESTEDGRRVIASRANSVRFDESANNHYASSSRQSMDLPARTGSGLGTHPLTERSLSHRSDGRTSTTGFPQRTNSFGLEQSRLLGSINNSPRVTGNPPPGFSFLGPFPAIVRCWLTETFSHSSLLYAAICTGSMDSSISTYLVENLRVADQVFEENGLRKIKLPVYFTEARIHQASPRSGSPMGQVPSLLGKFHIVETHPQDITIQVIIGSNILRGHNADILFSQERLMVFDEDRNQLSIPLVRPENEDVYKNLTTSSAQKHGIPTDEASSPTMPSAQSPVGIIGRPSRVTTEQTPSSPPTTSSGSVLTSNAPSDVGDSRKGETFSETATRSSIDLGPSRVMDDSKSVTESEKSFITTPTSKPGSGVWSTSWRSNSGTGLSDKSTPTTASSYARAGSGTSSRTMKVLRPSGKSMSSVSRTASNSSPAMNGGENVLSRSSDISRKTSQNSGDMKSGSTKANPVGSGSAFGWLNNGSARKGVTSGS